MNERAGGVAHPEEDVSEAGVIFDDIFGQGAQTFIKGTLSFRVLLADRHWRSSRGGEERERVRAFVIC